jgi:DNA-binding HxlR family transcriptional regulator
MRQEGRSGCPINRAVEALGDHWTLLVLRDIVFGGRRHFRELLAGSQEGIASNILADRLRRLVEDGMLTRDDAGRGKRATYSLTESSIQLIPVFVALGSWGLRHRETTEELAVRAELLEQGGPEMWADFMDELREQHLGVPRPRPERPSVRERLAAARAEVAARPA